MAKFNSRTVSTKTVNHAGGEAFKESPKLEFVSILLTSFVKDQFYRSEGDTLSTVTSLIDTIPDKKFVAKAAIYARTKFGMRSISHVVAAELAKRVKGERWTKGFYSQVVHRVDDMAEILAYYTSQYGKPIPNSLKKGLGLAFAKFDEYQLAKYRGENNDIKLVDIANLVHPRPSEKNRVALAKLIKDELRSHNTFQAGLSKIGQTAKTEEEKEELKAQEWGRLIKERKLGYFALVKNLRNIIEQAPEAVGDALVMLTDEKLIRDSLVLPFRYLTAIEEVQKLNGRGVREVLGALNIAIDKATANVPKFDGETLVAIDGSGSMNGQPADIAALFGAILYKANSADLMIFSEDAQYISPNPADSTMTIAEKIHAAMPGGGTNFHSIFHEANRAYKRIIILSDMQGWIGYDAPTGTLSEYKKRLGAEPLIYSFDLQGYGTLEFPERNVYALAGFSDKTFDIMKLLETDKQALITEVEKIEL